jgi:leucyl/phenylalanyl-tRNA--protein transferase
MFHRRRDASKIALVHLIQRLDERGFTLLDVQQSTGHLQRMGATVIPRSEFLVRLRNSLKSSVRFADSPPATC